MSPGARVPGDPTARPLPIVPVLQAPADIPAVANLGNLLRRRARLTPDRPACYRKILRDADGRAIEPRWETLTWRQFHDRAATVARGLIDLGLAVGARVAILGPTNVEWGVCDFGGHLAGLATAGIYPRQTAAQIRHLLQHSGAEAIFVAGGTAWGDDGAQGREELANVVEAAQDAPDLRAIVVWGAPGDPAFDPSSADDPRLRSLDAFAADPPLDDDALDARLASVGLDDLAILIYTSGTTGPPKAAMIS
ncbi:MAG: AMP-binding protein, partial [Acidobacteriota bacterium]